MPLNCELDPLAEFAYQNMVFSFKEVWGSLGRRSVLHSGSGQSSEHRF